MIWDDEDIIPKVEKKEEKKPSLTKEELIKRWKQYYEILDSIYPIKSFKIQAKNGENLNFHHGNNIYTRSQLYCLRDEGYNELFEKVRESNLLGKENSEEIPDDNFKIKAFISVDREKKVFNFGVEFEYRGMGYGEEIYNNYLNILDILGIEDKEQYELRVGGNPNHEFFEIMDTKKLVKKTNVEPDLENATEILKEFSELTTPMKFSELNQIIKYAIDSNISIKEIAKAINDNGFKIYYSTCDGTPQFEIEDVEQFKSFGIKGIKPTCMHQHFEETRNFSFMMLFDDIDEKDATLEFRRVFEEIKKKHKEKELEEDLKRYGELEEIILYWKGSGLLLKNVTSDIKELAKKQAISKFEEFDPEHKNSWGFQFDYHSYMTLKMLQDAELMDKDTYIILYQRALNRNYSLEDFDGVARNFIEESERQKAKQEISKHIYCPSPKGEWQKSYSWGEEYISQKIKVPENIIKNGNIRNSIKQRIIDNGVAKKTKIKTDMIGTDRDGKHFEVDNLKDWLFGVPGAYGHLTISKHNEIVLPPQTPKIVGKIINEALNELEHPISDER